MITIKERKYVRCTYQVVPISVVFEKQNMDQRNKTNLSSNRSCCTKTFSHCVNCQSFVVSFQKSVSLEFVESTTFCFLVVIKFIKGMLCCEIIKVYSKMEDKQAMRERGRQTL